MDYSTCVFKVYCPDSEVLCVICKDRGVHYLIQKLFLPKSNIPRRYLKQDPYDFQMSTNLDAALDFVTDIREKVELGENLYLYSAQPGTGKTSVGCYALLKYLFLDVKGAPYDLDNRRAFYLNVPEFLDRLRKSFNSPDPELEGLLEELTDTNNAPRLILFDDLGAERPSEWAVERLYTLINFRTANMLSSIYTSNLDQQGLSKTLGPRIASRVFGYSTILELVGKDHRSNE